ncbi:spermidine/putrescine ABC transporter ATP-binding protein [Anaerobacillus alkalidiazotrophicus]|uniref:Spermidine/putrescine ABC transporter ATP-binding protein n=1 Tax=Anaerobacillus alkalidiazotrophicus TaxID=472963 RepID=A0A1S2M5Q5_9BACI|nr:ABC transporter ATP-binding protein [Anaerobacillus alkalidiazotrophicus]OIJ18965.1 spermidine/putrescine ABC transporter ATP-binding protein [Anaerobacillus alkalidiazotrophicus]
MEKIITFSDVFKKYGLTIALNNVSLQIPKGGIIGLVGSNGSGKSTLLKLTAGLLKKTSGEITVCGENVTRLIGKKVAFLAEVDSLYEFFTVSETIALSSDVFDDFDQKKAIEIIETLNVDQQKKVGSLSKGNRARVKIAITLARKAPLLIMDEPLSGLDPLVREDIIKMIARYVEMEEQTLLISTHEVTEIEPLLDYVVLVRDGEIMLSEKVEDLREKKGQSVLDAMKEVLR